MKYGKFCDGIEERISPDGVFIDDPDPFYYHDTNTRQTLRLRAGGSMAKAGRRKATFHKVSWKYCKQSKSRREREAGVLNAVQNV